MMVVFSKIKSIYEMWFIEVVVGNNSINLQGIIRMTGIRTKLSINTVAIAHNLKKPIIQYPKYLGRMGVAMLFY